MLDRATNTGSIELYSTYYYAIIGQPPVVSFSRHVPRRRREVPCRSNRKGAPDMLTRLRVTPNLPRSKRASVFGNL
jgi:hypothetical protein